MKECPLRSPNVVTWCYGYVVGFSEAFEVWASFSPTTSGVCLPHEASIEQLLELGNRFMRAHPEMWHEPAGKSLLAAWMQAWPCQPSIKGNVGNDFR